ncbi:MAG TPA: hypothetical protein VIZ65_11065 [Cellvibrionaceae bacterium]
MKSLILSLLFFTVTAHGATFTINTKILKIRTVSDFNPVTTARNNIPFQVTGPLEGGCSWLYFSATNKDSYSLILAAKMADKTIGIQYSDAPSPWHAGTCQVHHLDLD